MSNLLNTYREDDMIDPAVVAMETKFKKYWSEMPILYALGVIVDPKIKLSRLEFLLEFIGNKLFGGVDTEPSPEPDTQPLPTSLNILKRWKKDKSASSSSSTTRSAASSVAELNRFLEAQFVADENTKNFDMLLWWKTYSYRSSVCNTGTIYLMRIDWDGLFRIYSHNLGHSSWWSVLWNSTSDRCAPKGICGLNSCCIPNYLEPGCSCLPGFALVNQGNWTSGCERNFTAESCKNTGKNYTIQLENNTIWGDVSYSVLSQTFKEDCMQACMVDCNCEAALYKDGECKKQRLPLRFGRRSQGDYSTFIKVEETSESSTDRILPTREGKKVINKDIIISCLFVSLVVVNVAILGIIHHRYRLSSYRRISYNGNIEFSGDIAPRSYSYAELEVMTD
ncbi:hypothetical protein Dsin_016465 [Dipteronia sinensis]|uniref:Uncharacterized protein n=1 Tax=Dipteronia sinensis TaxID=43782 RepID=A0AAE0E5N1_9ROSI|nr:hypothetical protein Dsin_016465 [Dipteronia sinensis]